MTRPTTASNAEQSVPGTVSQSRIPWLILGIASLARLLIVLGVATRYPHDWLFHRGIEMGLLADSLVHGLGYSSPFGGVTGPTAFIAPGYPTLVAGVFLLFGSYTFASAIVIMLLQTAISVLTVCLIMHVAREALDQRTASLAGAFWAISLPLLFIPTIFWETSLSACAIVGMVALALRCRRSPTVAMWLLFGSCAAVAGLINPALLPSLGAIVGWVAYETWGASHSAPVLGILAMLVVFSPWPIRNAVRFHAFIPTRTTVGFELWMGNRPGSTGYLDESIFPMYNKQELASYLSMGEMAYTRQKSAEAWGYIRAQPARFVALSARRFFRFWSGTGSQNGSPVYVAYALLTTLLGFAGLAMLYRRRLRCIADLMLLPLLLFPLPYYITHAEFRYRLNLDPLLTLLAAYAVTQFATLCARPRPPIHQSPTRF
jgi:NADH:ubiquinone oxidoreductase subunit 6 (subunit J)